MHSFDSTDFAILFIATWLKIMGDIVLKVSITKPAILQARYVILAAICYAMTAPFWAGLLQGVKFTTTVGFLYPLLQMVCILLVGGWFGERLNGQEIAGVILAAMATALLVRG